MKRIVFFLMMLAAFALAVSAGNPVKPVATASSSTAFLVGGNATPGAGVGNWPVFAGQSVQASNQPVFLSMQDGSRVLLDPKCEVTFGRTGDHIDVKVNSGSLSYQMAQPGSMTFGAGGKTGGGGYPPSGIVTANGGVKPAKHGQSTWGNHSGGWNGPSWGGWNHDQGPHGGPGHHGPPPVSAYHCDR